MAEKFVVGFIGLGLSLDNLLIQFLMAAICPSVSLLAPRGIDGVSRPATMR